MAGKVSDPHPDYEVVSPDWELMRDAIAGETTVKDKTDTYLPMPSGFKAQDDGGAEMYAGYILRGKFPEIMGPTLRGMVGIIHRIPAEIELPAQLEPLREVATTDGLPLTALHERITYELLGTGRYGLLVDASSDGQDTIPYIAGYKAESIINWSRDADFYVLDETCLVRDGFEWVESPRYRVLELTGASDNDSETAAVGEYTQVVWEGPGDSEADAGDPIIPQMKGGTKFDEIPFVIIGSTDVVADIDEVPLIGVARAAFNMYRLDTDYKWQLFMSGQETLFVMSDTDQAVETVGAGVVINIPSGSEAKYVGPSGVGITAHKEAILDERYQAVAAGAKMFDTEHKAQESGEALKIRWAAQTASLTTIALNSAKGLERALKYAAEFIGANPDEVIVKPSLRFIDSTLEPQAAKYLMDLWMGGAISKTTLSENLQRGDIATYDRSFEDEEELINQEIPDLIAPSMVREDEKADAAAERMAKTAPPSGPKLVVQK